MDKTVLEVEFDLAQLAVRKGAAPDAALGVLQKHWNYELEKRDWHPGDPGDHGIRPIGAHEDKVYRALIAGQPDLARQLRELVDQLYEKTGGTWEGLDPYTIDQSVEDWKAKAMVELASHPMQAYLIGQMLATEAAINHRLASARRENRPAPNVGRAVLHRPVTAEDRRAIEFLEHNTFNELDSKFEEMKSELRQQLIGAAALGKNPREVARAMANTTRNYNLDFGTIAITETARAESQGRLQELLDQGFEWCIGSSAHDSRVCDHCLRLINDKARRIKDIIGESNYGRKVDDYLPVIPLHPRSVTEDCRVITPDGLQRIGSVSPGQYVLTHHGRFARVLATSRRKHSGSIFDIGGARITGDHAVLTRDGWRLPTEIGKGDNVLGIGWEALAKALPNAPNAHNGPAARLEQRLLVRVLSLFPGVASVPAPSINLYSHQSVRYGDIDIQVLDSVLRNRALSQSYERVVHQLFENRHRALTLKGEGVFESLSRHSIRVGDAALLQAVALELRNQIGATASDVASKLLYAEAVSDVLGVKCGNLVLREHESSISQSLYGGDVVCLQVERDASFIVEGIAVHNCRCVWLPYEPT
jgi:hypothetical protein